MARWVHLCWSLPLLLVVLALGALDYLAYTPAGLKTVETVLNRRIGPVGRLSSDCGGRERAK